MPLSIPAAPKDTKISPSAASTFVISTIPTSATLRTDNRGLSLSGCLSGRSKERTQVSPSRCSLYTYDSISRTSLDFANDLASSSLPTKATFSTGMDCAGGDIVIKSTARNGWQ